jgi:hypothetical protein
MQILARCPRCDARLPLRAADAPPAIACGQCGREIALQVSESLKTDRAVDRCPICEGGDFYRRKDFNPQLGLTVVVLGGLVSAVFYWFGRDLIAYGILAAAALIDLVVYTQLKDITVCYRCHAEFRGTYTRTAPAFDLHTADVLEQEYERRIGRR